MVALAIMKYLNKAPPKGPGTFAASLVIYKVKRKVQIKFSIRAYMASNFWGVK